MQKKQKNSKTTNRKKKLVNLMDHNIIAWSKNATNLNQPMPNGIACPNCREELMDSHPFITLTSWPAQKNVHCSKCEYTGFRIA